MRWIPLTTLLLVLPCSAATTTAALPEIVVNCDNPGANLRLAALLRSPGLRPGATLRIQGTCSGYFIATAADLRLVGAGADAGIRGSIVGREPGQLVLEGLKLSGGNGAADIGVVDANGPERRIGIVNCEIDDAENGVQADGGARILVRHSTVRARLYGVIALRGASIRVDDSVVEGAEYFAGVSAFAGGSVEVTNSTIRNNRVGLWAENLFTARLQDTQVSENAEAQLVLRDRSQGALAEVILGTSGGMAPFAVFLEGDSTLAVAPDVELFGDVWARTGSAVWLEGGVLHTSVVLQDFSRLRAVATTIEGSVQCESGADAVCGPGTTATTAGCPSAPASCAASTAGAWTPFPEITPGVSDWRAPSFDDRSLGSRKP